MLANRKQEWDFYVDSTPPDVPAQTKEKHSNRQFRVRFFAIILFLTAMAMVLTIQSSLIVKAGYEVVQTKSEILKLEKENELLQLDIAKMKSPQRIQTIATKDLGMVAPQNVYHASAASQKSNYITIAQQQSKDGRGTGTFALNKAEPKSGL